MNSKELRDKKVEEVIAKLDRKSELERDLELLWSNFQVDPDKIVITGRKLLEKYLKRGNAKRKKVKASKV